MRFSIMSFLLVLTSSAQSWPQQTPSPLPQKRTTLAGGVTIGPVLYRDGFSDPGSGLFVPSLRGGTFELGYVDGTYQVRVVSQNPLGGRFISALRGQEFKDVAVEAVARAIRLSGQGRYGVGVRFKQGVGNYHLRIEPDTQRWFLIRDHGLGKPFDTIKSGSSSAIKKGTEPNRLLLVAKGATLLAYVNGELMASVKDTTHSEGSVIIMVQNVRSTDSQGLTVAFIDFQIYAVE
jgi:hypothetical protein